MTSSLLTPTRGLKAQGTEDTLVRLYSELGFAEQAKCCPIVAVPVDEDDVENWLLFFESLPSRSLRKLKITSNIKLPAETGKARHWKDMSAASRYRCGLCFRAPYPENASTPIAKPTYYRYWS